MTRRSKKELILRAALEVIDAEGVDALTFDAVAARAGLTRAGVVYHYATRDELVEAVGGFLLETWRSELVRALDVPVEESSVTQRVVALVRSCIDGRVTPGEFAFLAGAGAASDRVDRAWESMRHEWVGQWDELTPGQHVAILASDGYWLNVASGQPGRNPSDPAVTQYLLELAGGR